MSKYHLKCTKCGFETPTFLVWFEQNQACPKCGSKRSEIIYNVDYSQLKELIKGNPESFWHYFDFLPLENKQNSISCGEGTIPIEAWAFLSDYAREKHGIDCEVFVYRNDLNGGTGTFKDVAGALAASVFKENGVTKYCAASTGNTATAYSKYLALAGVKFTVFVPENMTEDSETEMISFGQTVVRCNGDYAYAKAKAAEFSEQEHVLISTGNIDPVRVEAKRTMVFEFLRQLGKMPDVYIQAISGGTGPIAIDKGIRELKPYFPQLKNPKMLMVQQDLCDPMVQAWESAKAQNFPEGYESHYPVIDNPQTSVSILSTGNPAMYPIVAPIVKQTDGDFLRVKESDLTDFAKMVYHEKKIHLGPASLVCLAGFFEALRQHKIENGQTVLVNTGEGALRAKKFLEAVFE